MTTAGDMWICGVCRSVNTGKRTGRCYKCNTPREVGAREIDELDQTKPEELLAPKGAFQSAETFATTVTALAVLFIVATMASLVALYLTNDAIASGDDARAAALRGGFLRFLPYVATAIGIGMLVAYGSWIRRAIENLPALGLGYARVSPTWAFVEPLIPGVNLAGIPARMIEVAQKLGLADRAFPLIGLAGLLFTAPVAGAVLLYRFTRIFGTGDEFLRLVSIGALVIFACQAVAIGLLVVVLWQIEGAFRDRSSPSTTAAAATPGG